MARKAVKPIESFGAIKSDYDIRDYVATACASETAFPKEFKLEPAHIKNQGVVGSCVAHTLSSLVEYYNREQEDTDTIFSTGYIYGNRDNSGYEGTGMNIRYALDNLLKFGDVPEDKFPENIEVPAAINLYKERAVKLIEDAYPNRISSYFRLNTPDDIKACLMQNGPVVVCVRWYKDSKITKGVLKPGTESSGLHCVYLYGWNEKGWYMANSWGEFWGESGSCILSYDYVLEEIWGVTDNISQQREKELEDKLDKLNTQYIELYQTYEEQLQKIKDIEDIKSEEYQQLLEKNQELEKQLEVLSNQIDELEQQKKEKYLDIEKPEINKLWASIVNFFVNLVKKIFSK